MKGIILAGGTGSRLYPLTRAISKQLVPIYDKPMIYYPLSSLLLAGIKDILVITTPHEQEGIQTPAWRRPLAGIKHSVRRRSRNLKESRRRSSSAGLLSVRTGPALVLGDNIFYGQGFSEASGRPPASSQKAGATIFAYQVRDPKDYGVVEFDEKGRAVGMEEKPAQPRSPYAITGLYFYDNNVVDIAAVVKNRRDAGELEITDVNRAYLKAKDAAGDVKLGRGMAWLDTGTHDSLMQASNFIQTIEQRQGLKIACLEEIAYRLGYISAEDVKTLAAPMAKNEYGQHLLRLLEQS